MVYTKFQRNEILKVSLGKNIHRTECEVVVVIHSSDKNALS